MLTELQLEDPSLKTAPDFTPGLYADIPFEEYLAAPGISKHGLDLIARSPLHYQRHQNIDTPALALGRAVHCAVLEPERFKAEYAIEITVDRRTKEGKARWAAFLEQTQGKTLLSENDYEKVQRMAESVYQHPAARQLLDNGHNEISAYWHYPGTDIQCRARPDFLSDDMRLIADLKTCADASPNAFAKAAAKYRYHVQDAWYRDGLEALGCPKGDFVFLCVESTAPFAAACYILEPAAVDLGRELYAHDMEIYMGCLRNGQWSGYSDQIERLELPRLGL